MTMLPSNRHLAGMEKFAEFPKLYTAPMAFIDRTGTVKTPLRTKSLFPMPQMRTFTKTYEEVCNERAVYLHTHAKKLGVPLYIMWSGGIDSTLALVSLLKNATAEQKKNMTVLLNEHSIAENPRFYHEHIQGKLRRDSSTFYFNLFGAEAVITSGELNDQVFGAESGRAFMQRFGANVIHQPYDRGIYLTLFTERMGPTMAPFYVDLYERFKDSAPIDIVTNNDVNWWFGFAIGWQSDVLRPLSFIAERNTKKITWDYLTKCYLPFCNTEDFQLWSMNNLDKRIKDTWNTYKWPAKDVIYGYTEDTGYRDTKTKKASLQTVHKNQKKFHLIDSALNFSYDDDLSPYHEPDNDFL